MKTTDALDLWAGNIEETTSKITDALSQLPDLNPAREKKVTFYKNRLATFNIESQAIKKSILEMYSRHPFPATHLTGLLETEGFK